MRLASSTSRQELFAARRPGAPTTARLSGTGARALGAAAIVGFIMCVFQWDKQALFPHIGMWTSHLATILFVTLVVAVLSFSVFEREEGLRREMASNEMRYRLLFWKSLTGAYRTTVDGRILDCNVAFCQMFGYSTREEVIGQSVNSAYFSETDRVGFIDRLQAEEELTNFEQRLRRKDGSTVWVLNSAALVGNEIGEGLVIKGTITDITERIEAQQENRRLADIVRCSDDAIFSITTEGVIQTWNAGAERTYGYSAGEILGRSIHILAPSDRAAEVNENLEKVRSGCEVKNLELVRMRKDGQQIAIHLTVSPTTDLAGNIVGASTIARDITEQKRAEAALRQSEVQYRFLFESNPVPMWVFDRNSLRFLTVNQAAIRQYGFTQQEFLAKAITEIRPEEDIPALLQDVANRTLGIQERGLWKHRKKNSEIIDVEIVSHPLNFGGTESMLVAAHDLTERKRAGEAVQQAEEKYRAIFEDAVIGIFQATPDGRLTSVNRALAHMHGYDSPEELLAEISNSGSKLLVDPSRMIELAQVAAERGTVRGAELEIYQKNRTTKWVRMNLRAVRDSSGNIVLCEGTVEDITEQRAAQERIKFLSYYDALTELPHRAGLQEHLENALADARRRNEKIALLFLDLDRFKIINDSFGHSFGDLVLKDIAKRLRKCAREPNIVARVGGDEFIIVLTGVQDAADVAISAQQTLEAMNAGFDIHGQSISVGCSIGVSLFPEHGAAGETLMKSADAAMYAAKHGGGGSVRFFTDEMNAQAVERVAMDKNLRLALDRDEFFLEYQPQVEISSGRITGLEALIRWQHPEMGLVPPDRFISIAENNGLILPIGEWVLRTACAQARRWQEAGLLAAPVAVNVSAVQFRQESFRDLIRKVLQETGLSPEYLELELTESLLLANEDVTLSVLQELKEMGIKLSIDDFGTGYSSFSYLRHFSVDRLKIDKSFVRDVIVDCDDAAITAAIISMAKSLHVKVIAEGVENEAQMSFLREHRCDEIQGYYFSKPLSIDEATDKLRCLQSYVVGAGTACSFYARKSRPSVLSGENRTLVN